jgi:2-polyprenyl-3-methyl-5-hydroxy-6-metoxy-1,4-benzoquinol methylase
LANERQLAIADLGCGYGALVHCLLESGYNDVTGIDVSPEQVNLASQLGVPGVECLDLVEFLQRKPAAFDVVFLMDVLEHFERGEVLELLDLVRRALRVGGRAIIHVPNGEGLFGLAVRYGDLTHESCFTRDSMQQLLAACGFRDIVCSEDGPVAHGPKSLIRLVLWKVLTVPYRLMLLAETGATGHLLSRNMLVTCRRDDP